MFSTMLPLSAGLQCWPGDDVEKNLLESEEYQKLPSSRMKSVQEFLRIPLFTTSTLKDTISSIPRWRFIRETQSTKPTDAPLPQDDSGSESEEEEFEYVSAPQSLRNVARGQKGMLEESRRIFKGINPLAEFFLCRVANSQVVRLEVWRPIVASALYMGDKNLIYTINI